jgi:hypothetical protein
MCSAAVVDCATVGCSVPARNTPATFMMKIYPVLLRSVSLQPALLASV